MQRSISQYPYIPITVLVTKHALHSGLVAPPTECRTTVPHRPQCTYTPVHNINNPVASASTESQCTTGAPRQAPSLCANMLSHNHAANPYCTSRIHYIRSSRNAHLLRIPAQRSAHTACVPHLPHARWAVTARNHPRHTIDIRL